WAATSRARWAARRPDAPMLNPSITARSRRPAPRGRVPASQDGLEVRALAGPPPLDARSVQGGRPVAAAQLVEHPVDGGHALRGQAAGGAHQPLELGGELEELRPQALEERS